MGLCCVNHFTNFFFSTEKYGIAILPCQGAYSFTITVTTPSWVKLSVPVACETWHLRVCLSLRDNSFSPSTDNHGDHPALPLCLYFCHFNLVPTWNPARHFYFSVLLSLQRKSLNSHSLLKPAFLAHWHVYHVYCQSHLCPTPLSSYLVSFQRLFIFFHYTSRLHSSLFPPPLYQPQSPVSNAGVIQQPPGGPLTVPSGPRDPFSIIQGVAFSCSRTRNGSFPNRYFCRLTNTYTTS